jgi:hypothetical protein
MTCLRRLGPATAICVLASGALHAADTPKTKKVAQLVAVRGCLLGLVLTTRDETGTNTAVHQQFALTGDRETLKQLQGLSGHLIEVTGTLKGGTGQDGTRIAEKRIPKGRVYVGAGSVPVANPRQAQPQTASTARLDVGTFADIDTHCT